MAQLSRVSLACLLAVAFGCAARSPGAAAVADAPPDAETGAETGAPLVQDLGMEAETSEDVALSADASSAPPSDVAVNDLPAPPDVVADLGTEVGLVQDVESVMETVEFVEVAVVAEASPAADVAPADAPSTLADEEAGEVAQSDAPLVQQPDVAAEVWVAPDSAAALETAPQTGIAPPGWQPSWPDENGCEGYEWFDGSQCQAQFSEQKAQELTCWQAGKANPQGVGQPCQPGGYGCLPGQCCLVDAKKYGAFCSMPCNVANGNADCGAGAWCHTYKGICMPAACEWFITEWYPSQAKQDVGFPCVGANGNAKNLGKACEKTSDCTNLPASYASYCLGTHGGKSYASAASPSICTHGCAVDSDCGATGACIHHNGKPYFCAPKVCAGQFAGKLFKNAEPGTSVVADSCF